MLYEAFKHEIEYYINNAEFDEEELKQIDELTEGDINDIANAMINDGELTSELNNCIAWYINKRLGGQL